MTSSKLIAILFTANAIANSISAPVKTMIYHYRCRFEHFHHLTKNHLNLPNLSHSTPIFPLYLTYPTLSHLFHSTRFIQLYSTYLTLPHPSNSTPHILLYPIHPILPKPFNFIRSNIRRESNLQTQIKKHTHQLQRLDILIIVVIVMME